MKNLHYILVLFLLLPLIISAQTLTTGKNSSFIQKPPEENITGAAGLVIESENIFPISINKIQALSWNQVGTVNPGTVTQASISSDGSRLIVFYRYPNGNIDEGHVREWKGNTWDILVNATNECHDPDIECLGSLIAACFSDDGNDYGFTSNINGPWVTLTGTLLQHQWGIDIAIAQARPYMTYACRYSDGSPSSYMMLHISSPLGPGPSATLNGGWRVTYTDVGNDPAITGDSSAWYTVFRQGPNLYVMKGYVNTAEQSFLENIGDGFTVNGNPYAPEIVIYAGKPTVVWLENSGLKLFVACWNGSAWTLLGEATLTSGYFYSASAASIGSDLYISYVQSSGSPRISVNKWDGAQWSALPGVLESSASSTISTSEIAIWNSSPTVCFVEDSKINVVTTGPVTSAENLQVSEKTFRLSGNYPNPFNPKTVIGFELSEDFEVTLKIYDILGNEIKTLVNGYKHAGMHEVVFDGSGFPSGIYVCRGQAGPLVEHRKMILMK